MNRREKGIFGFGLVITLVLSLFVSTTTLGVRTDDVVHDQIYDTHIRNEVRVVGIDDASLKALGAWPWKRDIFADLLTTLYAKGARVVIFDVLFLEDRQGDAEMLHALSQAKTSTVFASKLDQNLKSIVSVYKDSSYASHGIAHVYPDNDGKVRTIPLFQKDSQGICYPSLANQAFIIFTKAEGTGCDTIPKHFLFQETAPKTLSLIDVLRGDVAEEDIKDKVIFIGSNSLDIEDHFVGQTGEKIPGVYVHASVFTTLLNNSFLQELNIFLYIILLSVLIAGLLYVVFKLKNIFLQGICLLGGALLIILITLIGFSLHNSISISTLIFPYIFISVYTIVFRYTLTERKNTYIKELFGQFVHPKVLANILKHNNLKLGGEKKYITILFSDIRGFTTMTEQMPAEELVETLNTYFEAMSPHIMDREGVIDKYIGDAIMAFWNAPVTVLHHEEKAVKAALAMVDALKVLQDSTPLQIGIGLHAGEAVVGNIGSSKRINYTIIGDAVNACSRLEGLTKKYGVQIIVSEQIKNAVMVPEILWRSVDVVRVKGKSEVMKLYEPLKNTPENRQKRENSDKAFVLYQNSDFEGAHNLYKIENDMYSKKMCERCKQLVAKSPAHWTGVWDWDEK